MEINCASRESRAALRNAFRPFELAAALAQRPATEQAIHLGLAVRDFARVLDLYDLADDLVARGAPDAAWKAERQADCLCDVVAVRLNVLGKLHPVAKSPPARVG